MISAIERDHFWFVGRRRLVLSLFKKFLAPGVEILVDVGCGTGFNLKFWSPFAERVIGFDRLVGLTKEDNGSKDSVNVVVSDVCHLPITARSVSAAVALDVLEHVPDEQMLDEVKQALDEEGLFLITVPAMLWLWSARDEAAGHMRRYSKQSLKTVAEENGFEILYLNFYQFLLFPIVVVSRYLGRSGKSSSELEEKPGKAVNIVLGWVTSLEVKLSTLGIRFPWGSTLVAVLRKK